MPALDIPGAHYTPPRNYDACLVSRVSLGGLFYDSCGYNFVVVAAVSAAVAAAVAAAAPVAGPLTAGARWGRGGHAS